MGDRLSRRGFLKIGSGLGLSALAAPAAFTAPALLATSYAAAAAEPVAGSFGPDGLDLGEPTAESLERLHIAAGRVVEMLGGEEFAELV